MAARILRNIPLVASGKTSADSVNLKESQLSYPNFREFVEKYGTGPRPTL